MNINQVGKTLGKFVSEALMDSVMIWGPPGLGKSQTVAEIAKANKMGFTDVRLAQIAPSDLRGLPVPDMDKGTSTWLPPEFLPRSGRGILFLDELNLAAPVVQGMAQQLVLDRRMGAYVVPEGWFVWAAGNRAADRAAVFSMPAPLANRFLHLHVEIDFDAWFEWAAQNDLNHTVKAFLKTRTHLLHSMGEGTGAFPTPRSWAMANRLIKIGEDISPAVGDAVSAEYRAFIKIYDTLPSVDDILAGKKAVIKTNDPSVMFAVSLACSGRAKAAQNMAYAYVWINDNVGAEYANIALVDWMKKMSKSPDDIKALNAIAAKNKTLTEAFKSLAQLAY
jgi:MoxR-like ATPase